jgi:hypothetical protein
VQTAGGIRADYLASTQPELGFSEDFDGEDVEDAG